MPSCSALGVSEALCDVHERVADPAAGKAPAPLTQKLVSRTARSSTASGKPKKVLGMRLRPSRTARRSAPR